MDVHKNILQIARYAKERGLGEGLRYVKRRAIAKLNDLPHTITFEPASVCNINCAFCYILKAPIDRGGKFLPFETFKKVIDDTEAFLQEVMLHWRGEPLMNKKVPDMVLYASKKGIRSSMSTNGLLLSRDMACALIENALAYITICVDGTDQDVYDLHRCGGRLDILLENIAGMVQAKREKRSRYPYINLQMIVTKKNEHQIGEFERLARRIGADGACLMSLFIDRTADHGFVRHIEESYFVSADQEGVSRYFVDNKGGIRLYNLDTVCPQDAKYPLVTCDGDVVGCCYEIFLKHRFGNVRERSFISIWNDRRFVEFRKNVMMRRTLDMCQNCMPKYREWTHRLF